MTRDETKKIIRIMTDSYPNYKPDNLSETVDTWCLMLNEYTYNQIALALKTYILSDNKGFAPSIGQLIDKVQNISQPQELNEMEAWSLVSKAIRNSGYYAAEQFKSLPPLVQKAVGLPDQLRTWALDEEFNENVVMSHFINCYRQVVAKEKEVSRMQTEVRKSIENANRTSYSGEIEQKRQRVINSLPDKENKEFEGVPMPDKYKEIVDGWKEE